MDPKEVAALVPLFDESAQYLLIDYYVDAEEVLEALVQFPASVAVVTRNPFTPADQIERLLHHHFEYVMGSAARNCQDPAAFLRAGYLRPDCRWSFAERLSFRLRLEDPQPRIVWDLVEILLTAPPAADRRPVAELVTWTYRQAERIAENGDGDTLRALVITDLEAGKLDLESLKQLTEAYADLVEHDARAGEVIAKVVRHLPGERTAGETFELVHALIDET